MTKTQVLRNSKASSQHQSVRSRTTPLHSTRCSGRSQTASASVARSQQVNTTVGQILSKKRLTTSTQMLYCI